MAGSQDYEHDPRNETALLYLNGALVPRDQAVVSVFDAGFALGDGVWESFRLHDGQLPFLDAHLDRLFRGARGIQLDIGMTRDEVTSALRETIAANGMHDGVHIRLMVTRGNKRSPTQDPRLALGPATVVIVPEWKQPRPEVVAEGLRLFTSTIRCTRPDMFDMRLNSHSRLHLITALLQAINAGADEALMLDADGFVSSCNSTNFFFVLDGTVCTSSGTSCFNGITRGLVIEQCRDNGIPVRIGDFLLPDVYAASEAFVTGTFGGITPVCAVDGRVLPVVAGHMTTTLGHLYARRVAAEIDFLSASLAGG
jgi:branched-chain amino acid aminotransferase